MKHRFYLLFTLLVTAWLSATAYDFMVDGIAYNINGDGQSVTVTYDRIIDGDHFDLNPNYQGDNGNLVIPETVRYGNVDYIVTRIGDWAFFKSKFIGDLIFPKTVTTIDLHAFSCSEFSGGLTIPKTVNCVDLDAFGGAKFSGPLYLETSAYIGESAFIECKGFTEVHSFAQNPCYIEFCDEIFSKPLYVPYEYIDNYKYFPGCWGRFATILPHFDVVPGVGLYYAYNNDDLTATVISGKGSEGDVVIPNTVEKDGKTYTVTKIYDHAFENLTGITSITIPEGLKSIGEYAFAGIDLSFVKTFASKVPELYENAFSNYNIPLCVPNGCKKLYSKDTVWGKFNPIYQTDADNNILAEQVSLNFGFISLSDCESQILTATVLPELTANKNITWKSSNSAIASVDADGNVTGVGPGTAIITATTVDGSDISASCTVVVSQTAKGISLNKKTLKLNDGEKETLIATILPENTTNKAVVWTSLNTDIATVDNNGTVLGVKEGTADVIVTTADGSNLSDTCSVTVVTNHFTTVDYDFFGGEEILVNVDMENNLEISGFQTDIVLPAGFSFALDEEGYPEVALTDRATRSHTISATKIDDSTIRVLSYSNTSKLFTGNEGTLFTVKIISDWNAPIGKNVVTLINTQFAGPEGTKYNISNAEATLNCYYIPGDANHDKKVSISDIIADARYILLQNPEPFHYKSANLNDDNEISVSDIVLTANLILGRYQTDDKKYKVQRMMGGDMLSASVVESRGDGSRTIAIALDGNTDFTAFQADFALPAGMEVTGARLSDRAGRSHSVTMNKIGGNTVRVLAYASDNAVFAGNSGDLLLIDVKGHGNIEMTNALFAEPNGCEHELEEIIISTDPSGINDLTVGNAPVNVYNTAGQLIRTNVNPETATQGLPAGFYLVGNKKVVVK